MNSNLDEFYGKENKDIPRGEPLRWADLQPGDILHAHAKATSTSGPVNHYEVITKNRDPEHIHTILLGGDPPLPYGITRGLFTSYVDSNHLEIIRNGVIHQGYLSEEDRLWDDQQRKASQQVSMAAGEKMAADTERQAQIQVVMDRIHNIAAGTEEIGEISAEQFLREMSLFEYGAYCDPRMIELHEFYSQRINLVELLSKI